MRGGILLSSETCPASVPKSGKVLPTSIEAPMLVKRFETALVSAEVDWLTKDLNDDVFTRSTSILRNNSYSGEYACMIALDRFYSSILKMSV